MKAALRILWAPAVLRWAFGLAVGAVVALSLTPVQELPQQVFEVWDKLQHALGFAVLAGLGLLAFPARYRFIAGLLLVLGAAIEVAQSATGWRQGDVADWVADAVGIACGMALLWVFKRLVASRLQTP